MLSSMGRPKEHGERTRAALLAAAGELVYAEGQAGVTVRRVADAAGTTTRAVYSLFGDKEGLLRALYREVAETMRRHHEGVPERDDPVAEIPALALGYRTAGLAHPQLYDLWFAAVGRANTVLNSEDAALGLRSLERVQRTVHRCVAQQRFPGRDADEVVRQLFAMVHGLTSLELAGFLGDERAASATWRHMIGALLDGLQQPPDGCRTR
jgi:AcrR family transcriptional regulator